MQIETIPLTKIIPDADQPRQEFFPEAMKRLEKSLKEQGQLSPLLVEETSAGYLLIDGERRYRCLQLLGIKTANVIVYKPMTSLERMTIRFHVQEQQQSWTAFDKARAIQVLMNTVNYSNNEISEMLGMSGATVDNYMLLLSISKRGQQEISDKKIPFTFGRYIARIKKVSKLSSADSIKLEAILIEKVSSHRIVTTRELVQYYKAIQQNPAIVKKLISIADYMPDQASKDAGINPRADYFAGSLSDVLYRLRGIIDNKAYKLFGEKDYGRIETIEKMVSEIKRNAGYAGK